jgi:2-polyprenyl-3-methyl-5-hydroxy-6-metoxy-1,4-benzoquinol methylase
MLDLPENSLVLEIGAADSPIENMLKVNFNKHMIFIKTDVNDKYQGTHDIFDIEKEGLTRSAAEVFHCVILTEVLEHFDPANAPFVLKEIHRTLKTGGKLLLTTPTPQKPKEQLVWLKDHEFEYSINELTELFVVTSSF